MTMEDLLIYSETSFSAPQVACKLNRLLQESRFLELISVVRYDPGLTARIMQICHTPEYRNHGSVVSLEDAVNCLGNEDLIDIVRQISVSNPAGGTMAAYRFSPGSIWRHSVTTAIAAEGIWQVSGIEESMATSFTAGLLHDIGKVLISRSLSAGDEYLFQQHIEENRLEVHETESRVLGFNHAEIGGKLLEKWEQDEVLVAAVSFHHDPLAAPARYRKLTALVAVANQLAHHYESVWAGLASDELPEIHSRLLSVLGLSQDQLTQAYSCIAAQKEEVEIMMAII